MTPDSGSFRAERRRNRDLQHEFCLLGPFKKDSSTRSRVVNEVVLGTRVNKGKGNEGVGARAHPPFAWSLPGLLVAARVRQVPVVEGARLPTSSGDRVVGVAHEPVAGRLCRRI